MIQVRTHPNNNWLCDSGYSREEEQKLYDDQLQDILDNTRWYLDNLETLKTYRVYWKSYKEHSATLPFAHVKQIDKHDL
jgi:hypothetical protein